MVLCAKGVVSIGQKLWTIKEVTANVIVNPAIRYTREFFNCVACMKTIVKQVHTSLEHVSLI